MISIHESPQIPLIETFESPAAAFGAAIFPPI